MFSCRFVLAFVPTSQVMICLDAHSLDVHQCFSCHAQVSQLRKTRHLALTPWTEVTGMPLLIGPGSIHQGLQVSVVFGFCSFLKSVFPQEQRSVSTVSRKSSKPVHRARKINLSIKKVCVCIYIYTHTYTDTYIHTHTRTYIPTYLRTYIRTYIHYNDIESVGVWGLFHSFNSPRTLPVPLVPFISFCLQWPTARVANGASGTSGADDFNSSPPSLCSEAANDSVCSNRSSRPSLPIPLVPL